METMVQEAKALTQQLHQSRRTPGHFVRLYADEEKRGWHIIREGLAACGLPRLATPKGLCYLQRTFLKPHGRRAA